MGIAYGIGKRPAKLIVFVAHSCRGSASAIEHGLDEVGMTGQDGIVLTHKGCQERGKEVHAHFETTFAETVGDGCHRVADHVALGFEERRSKGVFKDEAISSGVTLDREEGIALGFEFGLDSLEVDTLGSEALCADRTATAQHTAHARDERLGADAVEEHAVEATVAEHAVVDTYHVGDVLRVGGTGEAEAVASSLFVVPRFLTPQVDSGFVVADTLGLSEDGQPEQHLDVAAMQVFAHLTVDVFVVAPANDDFLNGDELTHGIETADNLLSRIVWRMPVAQRDLDYKTCLTLRLLMMSAAREREEGNEK